MKRLVAGILAHVDAGKTTLSEGLLYLCGNLKKLGRVDHQDAFLDTETQERERGITIFSKQAELETDRLHLTILDTPGHVDFSSEMERTLQVLDYAILVISGTDGVQGHTETLWKLLQQYQIPVFIFVNKMDLDGTDRDELLMQLQNRLDDNCVDFSGQDDADFFEHVALCDETLMNRYLETGGIRLPDIRRLIRQRKLFPCWFGSALHLSGLPEFLQGLEKYTEQPTYPSGFGAKIFKISRDRQGSRLTWMKITGGSLSVKAVLTNEGTMDLNGLPVPSDAVWMEKADQIRIYSGAKYHSVDAAESGSVCAVTGLTATVPGQGLGIERSTPRPVLEPVLTYRVQLPSGVDPILAVKRLRELEEEDPQLHLLWDEGRREISLRLMGEVQKEVIKRQIQDRFSWDVSFSEGSIQYKETLAAPVEGVGHYEPLRHYAEVHLLLEPGDRGSGLVFDSICSTDELDLNWQRLILTHLEEKVHRGVLTGAPITDMKITLAAGRAHPKHTEGGDFRQATYRAVRQGLMSGQSVLLEPWYDFRLEIPQENLGRAMSDIQQRSGSFQPPVPNGDTAVLTGTAPAAELQNYYSEVTSYTRGRGHLTCLLRGYDICHNTEAVLSETDYIPESDLENTPDSIFCSHGSGTLVPWDQVPDYMHLPALDLSASRNTEPGSAACRPARPYYRQRSAYSGTAEEDKELKSIFEQTYGAVSRSAFRRQEEVRTSDRNVSERQKAAPAPTGPEYLLVDGYNIIFAWEDLKRTASSSLEDARVQLADLLCNYQGYKKCEVILVFDAYKVKGNPGSVEKYKNISIVYTKEAETADTYIEKATYEIGKHHRVRVATSDGLEQVIILGHGALRQSAEAFRLDVLHAVGEINRLVRANNEKPGMRTQNRVVQKRKNRKEDSH